MPGLIIDGKEVEVPGVSIRNFKDDPKLALRVGKPDGANDGGARTLPVTLVVLHTTKGIPGGSDKREQVIKPGFGPNTDAGNRTATYWSTDPTASGAHIVVDHNGNVVCLADLKTTCAYHAGQYEVNLRSAGIEIFQGSGAEMYEGQLDVVRKVVDVITSYFGIQRQIPDYYRNNTPIPRLQSLGGRNLFGVVGHRDVSDQRGKGDPGDAIMEVLAKNGYERFDFFTSKDIETWKGRQTDIAAKLNRSMSIDGIPGAQTTAALKELGYQDGLWTLPPALPIPPSTGTGSGHGPLESLIDAFFPTLVSAIGGDVKKALDLISNWIKQHQ
jgi:hypothetical protein